VIVVESRIKKPKENEPICVVQQENLDKPNFTDLKIKNYLFQVIDKSIFKIITYKSK